MRIIKLFDTKAYRKEYRIKNKDKIREYSQRNKNRRMQNKKLYFEKYPWRKTYQYIRQRTKGILDKGNKCYFKKGIKNYLTVDDLRFLWFRDKAYLFKKASIDRIDNNGNYTLDNCRYIEMIENCKNRNTVHTEEWKQKMSERVKGNKYRVGKHHSEETKIKISNSMIHVFFERKCNEGKKIYQP